MASTIILGDQSPAQAAWSRAAISLFLNGAFHGNSNLWILVQIRLDRDLFAQGPGLTWLAMEPHHVHGRLVGRKVHGYSIFESLDSKHVKWFSRLHKDQAVALLTHFEPAQLERIGHHRKRGLQSALHQDGDEGSRLVVGLEKDLIFEWARRNVRRL